MCIPGMDFTPMVFIQETSPFLSVIMWREPTALMFTNPSFYKRPTILNMICCKSIDVGNFTGAMVDNLMSKICVAPAFLLLQLLHSRYGRFPAISDYDSFGLQIEKAKTIKNLSLAPRFAIHCILRVLQNTKEERSSLRGTVAPQTQTWSGPARELLLRAPLRNLFKWDSSTPTTYLYFL